MFRRELYRAMAQVLEAIDANVLERTSFRFGGGTYLVWSVKGHIQVKVTLTGGINAVTSGIFLGGPAV